MNLVYDTVPRRARAALTHSIHAADDFVARLSRRPRRVLFEAASPLSLAVFRPVLERLRRDPRVEFWFTTADRSWGAGDTFHGGGIADRVITPQQARWTKFDGYINTDFWNTTWLGRRTRRLHLFHGVAGKYSLDAPVHIAPVVRSFDRILFANEDRLRRYIDAGIIESQGPRGQLVGFPKCDCLVDGSLDRRAIQDALGLDPSRPTVLYAPTWSAFSSLNRVGAALLPRLAALDLNVIVKLHDRSFDARSLTTGSIDWRRQLDDLCRTWGVHRAQDADISPYLFVSDVLVTDHSSAGFEFMLLDRPIVVLDSPDLVRQARVSPDKVAMLHSAAFLVEDGADIGHAVAEALTAPAEHRAARRAVAEELFYCPGSATTRAVRCIYDLLQLPLPAPAVVPEAARTIHALAPLARSL